MPVRQRDTILVVEPDAAIREVLTEELRDAGYWVLAVADVETAVAALNLVAFALVLTSSFTQTHDPTFAGLAALLSAAGDIPVVLATGHRLDPATAQDAGFRAVLEKPFTIEDLQALLRRVLAEAA